MSTAWRLVRQLRNGRIVGDLAAPALTLGRVYRVVTRQIDRISVRAVHYEKRIGRIRSIELQRGFCIGPEYRF